MIELFGAFLVEKYRQRQYVILILDEAQNLPIETLEEIRMLSNLDADNECLLQIILVGQPPLRTKLQRRGLRQLYQRVEVSYHLEPLDRQELKDYIRYRLATAGRADTELFDDTAMEAIFEYSRGVPRLINAVCHGCLVCGYADTQQKILRDVVETVLKDRVRWGLFAQANSSENQEKAATPSEPSKSGDDGYNHLSAQLERLIEVSEYSMKMFEKVAASLAAIPSEANVAALNEQLADERKAREALEHKLVQVKDALSHTTLALSQIPHEDNDRSKLGAISDHGESEPPSDLYMYGRHHSHREEDDLSTADQPFPRPALFSQTARGIIGNSKRIFSQYLKGLVQHDRSLFSAIPRRINTTHLIFTVLVFLVAGAALWFSGVFEPTAQGPGAGAGRRDFAAPRSTMRLLESAPTLSASKTYLPQINPDIANLETQFFDAYMLMSPSEADQLLSGPVAAESQMPSLETKPDLLTRETQVSSPASQAETYVSLPPLAKIRSKPDLSAPVLQRISQGTRVQVVAQAEDWLQLELKGGISGWIHHSLLRQEK
jgi:hypothetical protein